MRRAACVLLWLGTAAGSRYHPVTPGDEVCVVITGYNTADTVGDAVASVLQQTHQNLKVVFVDDGSRDATRCAVEQELAGDDRDHAVIALPANTPGGVGTAANRGMDACPTTSNYVAFLDADDVMAKTALADLVGAAQKHDADIVLGDWFKFEQTTGKQLAPYDVKVTDSLPRDTAFTVAEHPQVLQTSPVPWRKLYGADYLRANDVKFPQGDHFFEDNAFHWRALTASPETTRLAYASVLVVAHTVGDARQTTAGIDGADAEKLGGYLPNLNAIARELVDERAPEYLLREFANFLSQSKWIVARQQDTRLQAKFSRILRRDAVLFVEAAAPEPGSLRNALKAEFEDDAYVKFFGEEPSPTVELSVVVPTKDVGGAQITELLASLTNVPLTTEIFVVDDGSTDDTLAAVDAFRGSRDDVYLLRETASRGAGRARNRASPLLEGTYVVYIDADDQVDPQALAAAVHRLRADSDADLLFFPYAIEQSATPSGMWDSDQAAFARGVGAATPELRKAAALELTNYPWNRVARTDVLRGVQFGATRVQNDVRFHWTSIASARDVAFLDVDSKPAVIHRKGARQTLTDLSSSARLEVFAALAETRDSLGNAFLATNGPAFDRFARDLVVWAAPKIPLENKAEARDRCLDALGAEETATCERAFGAAGALQTPCEHLPSVPARAIRQLEMDSVAPNVYSFAYGWGSGAGWCDSDLDYEIGSYSGDECWRQCEAIYGPALVAVDWDTEGYCYCQNDCRCMNDVGYPDGFLATAESVAELPGPCSYEYSYSFGGPVDCQGEPTCPDGSAATCCDGDGSCTDGDDDYCCGADYYCSNDGAEYAASMGGRLCCPCTENCVACDGPGYEDCLQCDSGYVLDDEDGDGAGSCADDSESGTDGTVPDCSGDGENCPDSWVGDGYCDGADQVYGCDLTCYDNDGGDCEPPPKDWGAEGAGWCDSDLDEGVGATVSAQACWDKCVDTYGADVIKAIDWWSGECVCQNDCKCMEDQGNEEIHLLTSADIAALPDRCVGPCPDEEAAYQTCITENDSARGDDDGDDGDDGDDDVGSLSTCADVQARFSDQCELFGLWQCREPWFAYVECQVEALAASELNLNCDLDCRPPSPQPTASPTLSPTPAPFIVGEVTFEGLDEADADAHEDVIVDAIAEVAGVCPVSQDELHNATAIAARCPPGATPAVVTILSVSSSSRRRLDHVAGHIVVIEYEVEAPDYAAIEDVESALAKVEDQVENPQYSCSLDGEIRSCECSLTTPLTTSCGDVNCTSQQCTLEPSPVDEALHDAAKADGGDAAVAFAAVTTQQLHSEVVAPSPAPTAVPTLAPTVSPTTVEYRKKQQRKELVRNVGILTGIIVAAIVAGCATVALCAFAVGKGPCKKTKKTTMAPIEGVPANTPALFEAQKKKPFWVLPGTPRRAEKAWRPESPGPPPLAPIPGATETPAEEP